MKKIPLILAVLICALGSTAQSPVYLMGAYWNGTNEISRHLDISSGSFNDLMIMPGATSMVQGESTYDAANNRYFDRTNLGITVMDGQTGAVMSVINTTVSLLSFEYNPNTGNLLGCYWNGSAEIFASLNISTGQVTNIATLPGVTSIVQGESTFDPATSTYFHKSGSAINVINATTGAITTTINNMSFKGMEFNPNTGKLVGSFWNGSSEIYATMDISTGAVTNIATLTGVSSLVQGESTFDATGNRYFNKTNLGTMVVNAQTGAILNAIPGMSAIAGIEFIGAVSNTCNLSITSPPAQVNGNVGSNVSLSVSSNVQNASLQWQSNASNLGWGNVPNNSSYSGATSPTLTVSNLAVQNHQQAFRAIATSGTCSATSGVSYIHISDTCIVTDTVYITVTDVTGVPPPNGNIIHVYPNPAAKTLIIDNGNISGMSGYSVKINNSLGQQVFSEKITQKITHVDLSDFSGKGVYYLQILDSNDALVEVKKIIIQ